MINQLLLAVASLVFRSVATPCPIYNCNSSLASTTCIAWASTGSYSINSAGCKSGYYCSEVAAAAWAEGYSGIGGIYALLPCTLSTPVSTSTTASQVGVWAYADCYAKDPTKSFVNGGTVVTCQTSMDCVMLDNTKTPCGCSFRTDGLGICVPDPRNEDIFSGYYAACGSTNRLTDENAYIYWTLYMQLWVYGQSTVTCMGTFVETKQLSDAYATYSAAGWLALGGVLMIVY